MTEAPQKMMIPVEESFAAWRNTLCLGRFERYQLTGPIKRFRRRVATESV
jgi:hypothetical protein